MGYYILRIFLAGVIGFIIGLTVAYEDRTPSSRVFSIICMSAALITVTSIGFYDILSLPGIGDPGRLPAQVISALGFLGTGLIWITEDRQVAGMSSAAALWLTAILGIIIGLGFNQISVLGVFFFLLIYWLSHLITRYKKVNNNN